MRTCEGPTCDSLLPPPVKGGARIKRYCSDACRGRAARERAATLTEKKCAACKIVKPVSEFHAAYRGYCRECERAKQRDAYVSGKPYLSRENSYDKSLQRLYGITLAEYEAMLAAQDGKCAICAEQPDSRLHVDHDHASGMIRQLLCGRCNAAIGGARDDPDLLRAMITYLQRHKGEA
jgi:hypothetical protein